MTRQKHFYPILLALCWAGVLAVAGRLESGAAHLLPGVFAMLLLVLAGGWAAYQAGYLLYKPHTGQLLPFPPAPQEEQKAEICA